MTPKQFPLIVRILIVLLMGAVLPSRAEVKLHGLFSDNMVLQQGISVPVWGWADDGEVVAVEFRSQKVKATAKNGTWRVHLKKLKAGGPDALTVTGRNAIVLKNVLVGEVWIASGQSNMEWPLRLSYNADKNIAATANPMLRLYTVPKLKANEPTNNVNASWQDCNPNTTPYFSAVAYYFGRDLQTARGVPVGIIHTSWGGSPAEVWMSRDVLESNPSYKKAILDFGTAAWQKYQDTLKTFKDETAQLKAEGRTPTNRPPGMPWKPTELYNGMIASIIPYAIKGAIWYQGESNAGRAHQYRTLFPDMIRNWRRDSGQGDFTFLAVQLAPFKKIQAQPAESDWAELREAQYLATKVLPKVAIAVINDVGEEQDIHPKRKEPVGARLALAARGIAYGEKIAYSGPTFKSVKFQGEKAILSFANVDGGLVALPTNYTAKGAVAHLSKSLPADRPSSSINVPLNTALISDPNSGKPLEIKTSERTVLIEEVPTSKLDNWAPLRVDGLTLAGFSIAGADRKFVWAKAEIQGDKIVVSSPQVIQPVAVRFGWADYPVVNLWNLAGLPAVPFRTDDFPLITAPKD